MSRKFQLLLSLARANRLRRSREKLREAADKAQQKKGQASRFSCSRDCRPGTFRDCLKTGSMDCLKNGSRQEASARKKAFRRKKKDPAFRPSPSWKALPRAAFSLLLPFLLPLLVLTLSAPTIGAASGIPQEASAAASTSADSPAAGQCEEYTAPDYPLKDNELIYPGLMAEASKKTDKDSGLSALLDLEAGKERQMAEEDEKGRTGTAAEEKESTASLRERFIAECGRTLSFQKAVAWRYAKLNEACQERAANLNRIFNFQALLIDEHILPPILSWAGDVHTQHDKDSASFVEETYTIRSQARLVSSPPSWRDYLTRDFDALSIRREFLPKTSAEKSIWQQAVREGWQEGTAQADEVFAQNMDRLLADYRGMLRFTMLYKRGYVSLPRLAEGHMAIRVGKNTLDLNQTVFRLTAQASFQNPDELKEAAKDKGKRKKRQKRE